MRLNLRQVEIFGAVMTAGSVTAAAEMLRTSQPTVSRELSRLESIIGLRLFDRQRNRLKPTSQGLALYDEVRRSFYGLERIERAADSIRQFERGQISIACPPTHAQMLMPTVCRSFLRRYPGASVSIHAQDSPVLEEWLSAQRYDLGLTDAPDPPPATRTEILATLAEVCILPPDHPLVAKEVLHPRDFDRMDFVHLAAADPYRIHIDRIFHQAGIERRLTVETPSAEAVCRLVLQGVGLAIVNPLTALSYVQSGIVIRRFSAFIPYTLKLVRPEHRPGSDIVDHFSGEVRDFCDQSITALQKLNLT